MSILRARKRYYSNYPNHFEFRDVMYASFQTPSTPIVATQVTIIVMHSHSFTASDEASLLQLTGKLDGMVVQAINWMDYQETFIIICSISSNSHTLVFLSISAQPIPQSIDRASNQSINQAVDKLLIISSIRNRIFSVCLFPVFFFNDFLL